MFWYCLYIGFSYSLVACRFPKWYTIIPCSILFFVHNYCGYLYTFPTLFVMELLLSMFDNFALFSSTETSTSEEIEVVVENEQKLEEQKLKPQEPEDKDLEMVQFLVRTITSYRNQNTLTESLLKEMYNTNLALVAKNPSLYNFIKSEVQKLRLKNSVTKLTISGSTINVPLSQSQIDWL